jgi:hypothetical protein
MGMIHSYQSEYCSANRHSFGSRSADDPECRSVLPAQPPSGRCLLPLGLPRGHRRMTGRAVTTTGGPPAAGQGAILQARRPRRPCLGAGRCRGGARASRRFVHSPRCRAKRPSPMPARSSRETARILCMRSSRTPERARRPRCGAGAAARNDRGRSYRSGRRGTGDLGIKASPTSRHRPRGHVRSQRQLPGMQERPQRPPDRRAHPNGRGAPDAGASRRTRHRRQVRP